MLRGLLLEKLLQRELLLLLRELLLRETVRQHERFIFAAWSPPGGAGGYIQLRCRAEAATVLVRGVGNG